MAYDFESFHGLHSTFEHEYTFDFHTDNNIKLHD